ncbi:MAG TPA: hypothetical protein VK911_00565 [Vicinamibacterales bacterium]|nr:hypothetical protein [Vicinamibacterales bacterium]
MSPRTLLLVLSAVVSCGVSTAAAQTAPAGDRAAGGWFRPEASVTIGLAVPTAQLFREVYGAALIPVALQVEVPLGDRGFLVFGGVRHVRRGGEAVVETTGAASGQDVRFRMTTARFGVGWRVARGAWMVAVAGGPAYSSLREEWEGLDLVTDDRALGIGAQASLSRAVSRRISLLLRTEYSWARSSPSQDDTLPAASLGAIDLAGGIAVRF